MKLLKFSFIITTLFLCNLLVAQTPPSKVTEKFKEMYPNAKNVEWMKDSPKEWAAEFMMNGNEMAATFLVEGVWVETETVIEYSDLPQAVADKFKTDFGSPDDLLIVKVENAKEGLFYEFGFGKNDLFYRENGERVQ